MKGFNPLASITTALNELTKAVKAGFAAIDARFAAIEATQQKHTEMLELLVAEVSRYKNDSGELLVSVYAYCTVNGIKFSHGDLFKWGGKATRFSRKHGFKIEQTNDPRFGEVNLYEQTVLDNVVEM